MSIVSIETNLGSIKLELDDNKTPNTTQNFLNLAEQGYYNGTIFHRVINNFMIQGGGIDSKMQVKPGAASIENEAETGLSNDEGTIAMARSQSAHSASSQFFINVANNHFLNFKSKDSNEAYGYCAFGRVIEGMDLVKQIALQKTTERQGYRDVPVEEITINKVSLVEVMA